MLCITDALYPLIGEDVDVYDVGEIDKNRNFYRTIFSEGCESHKIGGLIYTIIFEVFSDFEKSLKEI